MSAQLVDKVIKGLQDLRTEHGFGKVGLKIGELAGELQQEIFSHLDKAELEPWIFHKPTHLTAKAQLWSNINIIKFPGYDHKCDENCSYETHQAMRTQDKGTYIMEFCDFVYSSAGESIRKLVRELTLTVPEPFKDPVWHDSEDDSEDGSEGDEQIISEHRFWNEKSWDVQKLERTLSLLTGLKTLRVHTHRPRNIGRTDSFTGSVEIPVIALPDHIKQLYVSETTEETMQQDDQVDRRGALHIGLFRPGRGLTRLSYTSNMIPDADCFATGNSVGSAGGLDKVHTYPNVTELRFYVGDDPIKYPATERVLDSSRLLRNLQSLPALRVLEIWTYPYGPSQYDPYNREEIFPRNWPALLPKLEVFRCPLRNFVEYLSKTSSAHDITIEIIVDEAELCNPEIWKDANIVHVLFKLAEECAHYLAEHPHDKRKLVLHPIEVSEEHRWVYYSANRKVTKGLFTDHPGMYIPGFFQSYMRPLFESTPGFAQDREEMLYTDEGSHKMLKKMAKWQPCRNLGVGWENSARCKDGVWPDWEALSDDGDKEQWLGEPFRIWHDDR